MRTKLNALEVAAYQRLEGVSAVFPARIMLTSKMGVLRYE